jgi:hypothetical protein
VTSGEECIRRWERIKGERVNHDRTWQRLQEIVWPFAGDFNTSTTPGERRTDKVFESTATLALERFAAFMESLLTPRNQTWHRLRSSIPELNESQAVKEWFDLANSRLFMTRNDPAARYYSQKHEGYKSLGAFGNDTLFVDARSGGGIRYKHCHLGHTWIEQNHEGVVDTVYYGYELTAHQAVQKWGPAAPDSAHRAMEADPLRKAQYVHVVKPRKNYDPQRVDVEGMGFESLVVNVEEMQVVERGGYHEQPYLFSRFTVNPAEVYGRGPAELILPDIEMLQEQEKTLQRSGHKAADPPLLLQSDGPLGRGQKRVSLKPGGLTYGGLDMNGRPAVVPLQTGANLPITLEMMQAKRQSIEGSFFVDLFLSLVDNREMTATEVMERAKEKGQLLTPTTGRQEAEMLGPQIDREIKMLMRAGMMPPLPQELAEAPDFEIIYDNEAARLQRSEDALAIERTAGWAIQAAANGGDPTLLEIPDWHAMFREIAEINGVDAKLLKDKDTVQQAIAAQAEQANQQQAIAQAQQGASAMKDLKAAGVTAEQLSDAAGSVAPS